MITKENDSGQQNRECSLLKENNWVLSSLYPPTAAQCLAHRSCSVSLCCRREGEVSAWGEEKLSRFLTPAAIGPLNLNSQSHKYRKALGYKPKAEFPLSSEAEKPKLESENTNCSKSDFKPQSSTGGPGKCLLLTLSSLTFLSSPLLTGVRTPGSAKSHSYSVISSRFWETPKEGRKGVCSATTSWPWRRRCPTSSAQCVGSHRPHLQT